jgi:putative acyl-CoA dehydrogenase
VAKFWICKRGSHVAQEAMECLGGNGYVEAHGRGTMARIYREMPLNSIWEGAGNIMALDLMRLLRKGPVLDALMHELEPVRGTNASLDAGIASLADRLDGAVDEAQSRRLVRDLAVVMQAALLQQHSSNAVFDAFCASRLQGAGDVFGLLPAGADIDAILKRASP